MSNGDNQKAMTIEQRIAQELKADRLGALLKEDELQQLVRDAIVSTFAARNKIRVPAKNQWEAPKLEDSPLTIIQEAAIEHIKPQVNAIADMFMRDSSIISAINHAIEKALPEVLSVAMHEYMTKIVSNGMSNLAFNAQISTVETMRQLLKSRGIDI